MDRPSPPSSSTRIPGRRVLVYGLIIVLGISGFLMFRIWKGLDYAPSPGEVAEVDTSLGAPAAGLAGTVVYSPDPDLENANLSSQGMHVGEDLTAFELVDRPGVWAVNLTWYYLGDEPLHLYNFAEMLAMEGSGRIDETTRVGFAVYRYRVEGTSPEEVARAAEARRPAEIPPQLLGELRRSLAAADTMTTP